jgi:hypothetical protein
MGLQAKFVHTEGTHFVAPDGSTLEIRGIGLGNWLVPEGYMWQFDKGPQSPREIQDFISELVGPGAAENFWKTYRDNFVTAKDIALLKESGFNAVRVPLNWELFRSNDSAGFELLDRLIAWCRAEGMYVVLDMHTTPGGQTGFNIDDSFGYPWLLKSKSAQGQLIAIWERIAMRYRNEPTVLGYDLLNEPLPEWRELAELDPLLDPLLKSIGEAVRQVDPNHVLIYTGRHWDTDFSLLTPAHDPNAAYTFHLYLKPIAPDMMKEYTSFRDRYKVPILLGESGETSNEWNASFRQVLQSQDIGWIFWPYKKMDVASVEQLGDHSKESLPVHPSGSSVVSVKPPAHWEEIVKFAQLPRGTANSRERIGMRPKQDEVEAALKELLQNVLMQNCRTNHPYINGLIGGAK